MVKIEKEYAIVSPYLWHTINNTHGFHVVLDTNEGFSTYINLWSSKTSIFQTSKKQYNLSVFQCDINTSGSLVRNLFKDKHAKRVDFLLKRNKYSGTNISFNDAVKEIEKHSLLNSLLI